MIAYKVYVDVWTSLRDDYYTEEYNGIAYGNKGTADIVRAEAERECRDNPSIWGTYVKEVDVPECEVFN